MHTNGTIESLPQMSEERVELHAALESVIAKMRKVDAKPFTVEVCGRELFIRIPERALTRILYCLLKGLSTSPWRGRTPLKLKLTTRACLSGYGAEIDIEDDGPEPPKHFLAQLASPQAAIDREAPGWQLLLAADLARRNGGKLIVRPTTREDGHTGTSLYLYLPLLQSKQAPAVLEAVDAE